MKRIHYGWLILFLAFLALLSTQAVRLSFGVFIPSWEMDFPADRGMSSFIAMVSLIV